MSENIVIPKHLLPDPAKLELLADWVEATDWTDDKEVQTELRQWARNLREFGVDGTFIRQGKK